MEIEKLICKMDGAPSHAFVNRVLPSKLKKIRSDFLEVAKAEKAGSSVPNVTAIARFVTSEYNIKMHRGTAAQWLEEAREELDGKNK